MNNFVFEPNKTYAANVSSFHHSIKKRRVYRFQFNMTSNVISISASKDLSSDNQANIRYQISVMARPSNPQLKQDNPNNEGTRHISNDKWVMLHFNQFRSALSQQHHRDSNEDVTNPKRVLLQKIQNRMDPLTWHQVEKKCFDLGGSLVHIKSEKEHVALQELITKR